jgi:hypothetical protein
MLRELGQDFIGRTQSEKWCYRAIHIGTFAVSQFDPAMRGVGTVVFGALCAAATGATFLEAAPEQPVAPVELHTPEVSE